MKRKKERLEERYLKGGERRAVGVLTAEFFSIPYSGD